MNNSYVTEINSASFHLSARLAYKSSAETMKLKGECCTLNDFISGDFIFFKKTLQSYDSFLLQNQYQWGGGGGWSNLAYCLNVFSQFSNVFIDFFQLVL